MDKMTLEKLLNILLERGWKPRNREKTLHICCYDKCKGMDYQWVHLDGGFMNEDSKKFRELVSKESGLWQFCVDNDIIDYSKVRAYGISYAPLKKWRAGEMQNYDNVHRLLWDCASLDENKLEQFLLDTIKIDE